MNWRRRTNLELRDPTFKNRRLPYPVYSFKGRTIDMDYPVYVHRNLNASAWSIVQRGIVRAHAPALILQNAAFKVSNKGWRRYLESGKRNVHARVKGELSHSAFGAQCTEPEGSKFVKARYNLTAGFFETVDFFPHMTELVKADAVLFAPDGIRVAMMTSKKRRFPLPCRANGPTKRELEECAAAGANGRNYR